MADTKVAQLTAMLQGMQNMSSTVESSPKTDAAFGALLSQTASNGYEQQYSWTQQVGKSSATVESNQVAYEKETARNSFKDNSFVKKSDTDISSKLPEDAQEKIGAVEAEIKEALEEKLNVSEEELVQAMEKLGLTIMDLANPANITQLAMELTGSQDGSELLLSPEFQALMSEVEELFGQLTEGLNLTPKEFERFSEQLAELQQKMAQEQDTSEQVSGENVSVVTDNAATQVEEQNNVTIVEAEETEVQKEIQTGETAISKSVTQTEETETADISTEETDGRALVKQTDDVTEKQTGEDNQKESGNQKTSTPETDTKSEVGTKDNQQTQVNFQTTTQTVNNGQTVEVVQTVTQSQIDVESIMRQISQMTKITVTQAMSSIEMQLNPENLGKVYLQVVSKEGAITAQIAAQNEAVKEILESQIAVLKENMNQQGMKVEAIEVTIASHEFEQNLEGNQENSANEQQEAAKPSRRGINLNNLDELEGLMSEEESLVAKIMQENGNSVDLTA